MKSEREVRLRIPELQMSLIFLIEGESYVSGFLHQGVKNLSDWQTGKWKTESQSFPTGGEGLLSPRSSRRGKHRILAFSEEIINVPNLTSTLVTSSFGCIHICRFPGRHVSESLVEWLSLGAPE